MDVKEPGGKVKRGNRGIKGEGEKRRGSWGSGEEKRGSPGTGFVMLNCLS